MVAERVDLLVAQLVGDLAFQKADGWVYCWAARWDNARAVQKALRSADLLAWRWESQLAARKVDLLA